MDRAVTESLGGKRASAVNQLLRSEGLRRAQPFLAAALLMLSFINFPSRPITTGTESWSHVMVQAREQGLRFGHDVIYTYGPAGFLFMPYFAERTPAIRLISDVVCAYVIALGVCLLAWQMKMAWRIGFLIFFIISPVTWFGLGMPELLFVFGVFCWGLLTRNYRWAIWVLIPFAALLALAKVSFLVIGGITMCAAAWNRRSVPVILAYAGTLVGFWLLLGQRLWDLWPFVRLSLQMSAAYDATMVMPPYPLVLAAGLATIALLIGAVWRLELPAAFRIWLAVLAFCVWKQSFVRSEVYHQQVFFGFAPLCAIVLVGTTPALGGGAVFSRIMAGACLLLSVAALMVIEPGWAPRQEELLENRVTENLHLLAMPADYRQATRDAVEIEKMKATLPAISEVVSNAKVDVFGWDLAYAPFNGLNFTPRPCCQSYASYTPELMRLNAEFYRTNAPDYVLFEVNALPGRFPPSEDAVLQRELAMNYEPVLKERQFILLKHARNQEPRLTLVSSTHRAANELQPIPEADGLLWCEVSCARHPIRRFFYSEPLLSVGIREGQEQGHCDVARSLLAAGFLLKPLLLFTDDVYGTNHLRAMALSLPEPADYRIYRVEPKDWDGK